MLPDRKARPTVATVNRNPDLAADLQNRTTGKELACQTAPALWKRAAFPALRQERAGGRQPRSGLERQLLGTMASAQTASESGRGMLASQAALASALEAATQRNKGGSRRA